MDPKKLSRHHLHHAGTSSVPCPLSSSLAVCSTATRDVSAYTEPRARPLNWGEKWWGTIRNDPNVEFLGRNWWATTGHDPNKGDRVGSLRKSSSKKKIPDAQMPGETEASRVWTGPCRRRTEGRLIIEQTTWLRKTKRAWKIWSQSENLS